MKVILKCLSYLALSVMLSCAKNEESKPDTNNREVLTNNILVRLSRDQPDQIECDKEFVINNIKFRTRTTTEKEFSIGNRKCETIPKSVNNYMKFRIPISTALEMDVSHYQGIKSISLPVNHINAMNGFNGSLIEVYDFNNKLIESYETTRTSSISVKNDLDRVKKIVIINRAEVTDIGDIFLMNK